MTKNIRRFAGISSGGLLLGLLSLAMFPASARADAESDGQARDLYEDLVNFPSSKLRGRHKGNR